MFQNIDDLQKNLMQLLSAACLQRPHIIMLDGVDQVSIYLIFISYVLSNNNSVWKVVYRINYLIFNTLQKFAF